MKIVNPEIIREAERFTDSGAISAQTLADVAAMRGLPLHIEQSRGPSDIRSAIACAEAELRHGLYIAECRFEQLADCADNARQQAATLSDFIRWTSKCERLRDTIGALRTELAGADSIGEAA